MPRRKSIPSGFISPCAPVLVSRPPTGPEWLHEIKQDGYRIIARKHDDEIHLWTRQANDWADRMAGIAEALRSLPNCVIDGEAVVWREDGSCDFAAIKRRPEAAILIAFDLLEFDGEDLRRSPIETRREGLQTLLRQSPAGIRFSEAFDTPGDVVWRHACALGAEGIISKRWGSSYRSGRSDAWRKTLCPGYERR